MRTDDGTGPGLGWFHPFRDFVRKKDHQGFTARDLARQVRVPHDNPNRQLTCEATIQDLLCWCRVLSSNTLGLQVCQCLVLTVVGCCACTHNSLLALSLSLSAPPANYCPLRVFQGGYDEVGVLLDNAEGRIEGWEAGDRAQEHALQRSVSHLKGTLTQIMHKIKTLHT